MIIGISELRSACLNIIENDSGDGEYYISEVNPRFGGGYPHAYESGVNVPALIFKNLRGEETTNIVGQYKKGICMMKYNEVCIREIQEEDMVE